MRLRFQKGDLLPIALSLLLAAAVFLAFLPAETNGAACAEIYHNGVLLRRVSLSAPEEFTLSLQYDMTITVRDGKIAVTASDCPGGDCVHAGFVGSPARSILCLPNLVEIRVLSDAGDAVDFIVG